MDFLLDSLYLPIFPESSLAHSIITTVWIGVVVIAFFNLRYGWVLSGIVVPGYLTPLLLVKPLAVWVIGVESLVVYLLVYLFSEKLSKLGYWGSFFGRDRFFAILIVSVLVRVLFDGWILPFVGEWYVAYTQESFDYRNNLHSFGLIIIALIANMLWKPGLIRGIPPIIIIVAITYFITRFVLIEYTNFTLSNLSYMYEDFSSNILASPKSYIILLTTAFIASRMNLRYGWDFNGILIPALLALQWYQPSKILISFFEAIVIYSLALLVMKLPIFKRINIEGARKLLLFFNIGFIYKICISVFLEKFFPEVKVSDYFGFGYLLSTLIAIKMFDKDIMALFIRATLQTSVVSIVTASIIGFSLTVASENLFKNSNIISSLQAIEEVKEVESFNDFLLKQKVALYENISPESFKPPTQDELELFYQAINRLKETDTIQEAKRVIATLSNMNIRGIIAEKRYVVLLDSGDRGWGIYVIDLKSDSPLLISVPAPLDEQGTYESALVLFNAMNSKALSFAGTKRASNAAGTSDVLGNKFTLFYKFFESFQKNNSVVIRGYTTNSAQKIFGKRYEIDALNTRLTNTAFINKQIPIGVSLKTLKEITNDIDIHWEPVPVIHTLNSASHQRFMEIFLTQNTRHSMMSVLLKTEQLKSEKSYKRIDGYFQQWVLNEKDAIAKKGSEKYTSPPQEEMLYFDHEVLTPLVQFILENRNKQIEWGQRAQETLNSIASSASIVNYDLVHYHHISSRQDYILLLENSDNKSYRGSYAIRLGESEPFIVEIPRPIYEKNTFEFGISFFERSKAMALSIGGAHPKANSDGSSDLLSPSNKGNFFTLVNQVILREMKQENLLVVSTRAFSNRNYAPLPKEDVVLAFDNGYISKDQLQPIGERLYTFLESDGLSVSLANGDIDKSGYEVNNITQAIYLNQTKNKEFVFVWLSPDMRDRYRQVEEKSTFVVSLENLGVPVRKIYFEQWVQTQEFTPADNSVFMKLQEYSKTRDPIILVNLLRQGKNLELLMDITTSKYFLLYKNGGISVVVKLQNNLDESVSIFQTGSSKRELSEWLYRKEALLKVEQ